MKLRCKVCQEKYEADVEGTDNVDTPVCVACLTTLFHGTALTPTHKIRPITLKQFRKRMKELQRVN